MRAVALTTLVALIGCAEQPPPQVQVDVAQCRVQVSASCAEGARKLTLLGREVDCAGPAQVLDAHISALTGDPPAIAVGYGAATDLLVPVVLDKGMDRNCTMLIDRLDPPPAERALRHFHTLEHPWGEVHNEITSAGGLPANDSPSLQRQLSTHPAALVSFEGEAVDLQDGLATLNVDYSRWIMSLNLDAKPQATRDENGLVSFAGPTLAFERSPLLIDFPDGNALQVPMTLQTNVRFGKQLLERRLEMIADGQGLGRSDAASEELVWAIRDVLGRAIRWTYLPRDKPAAAINRYVEIDIGEKIGDGRTCSFSQEPKPLKIVQSLHAARVSVYDAVSGERIRQFQVRKARSEACPLTIHTINGVAPSLRVTPMLADVLNELGLKP